ncbi:hypothetical protein E2C01_036231 [Portunus trituberculatus]|uniref:Uncharacterized protein n=1 Tax=Portunus trituberculatus TaxID=210409 RepID=A0A5B7FBW9_PORTR|nr:hypothetical protein [Portunus trituberculatus]
MDEDRGANLPGPLFLQFSPPACDLPKKMVRQQRRSYGTPRVNGKTLHLPPGK